MKKFITVFLLICVELLQAQVKLPYYADSIFSTYYLQRVSLFQSLPQTKDDIIFIGNSITDGGEWSEMFDDLRIKNRGISGDISAGIIKRIDEIVKRKPAKIFLMIGVNDLARGIAPDSVVKNILLVADYLKHELPETKIYVQSLLPVNAIFGKFAGHTSKKGQIRQVNERLRRESFPHKYTFIDLYSSFTDSEGKMDIRFSNDGLHLVGEGYVLWKHLVFPYLYDLKEKPALIPLPQRLAWKSGFFPLYKCRTIIITQPGLENETTQLKKNLLSFGIDVEIKAKAEKDEINIELRLLKIESQVQNEEAYKLEVTANKIVLSAITSHGIFNGLQTLQQLIRDKSIVDACEITDWPAFPWRGFMVDVGRNFQSLTQLKEQIDVMASYKLNIFHFHLTEDIAWRLESKLYPQLTEAKNMLRNPGEYYSISEMKELIDWCRKRHITLVPEIDMPGHSAAFKRAMGVDMQSDSGLVICKNIIQELCDEFDLPIIHVGGDEVKITNKNFLPDIITLLRSMGKTVVAWDPGGSVPEGTFLQMWNGKTLPKYKFPAIDSRHLYLNHFDPLEGVSATFNHIICDTDSATTDRKGATLCNWPDRRVSNEKDLIRMNAVYPVMLAFAERCWRGGGIINYSSAIGANDSKQYLVFAEFENRLLDHKQIFFNHKPFQYVKQSDIEWKLIGPFRNKGYISETFAPESIIFFDTVRLENYPSVCGGTIWLRHFWHPMIQSNLEDPEDSTTWYATRRIWSDQAGEKSFWIGFNNISRSPATDSPPINAWDNKGSTVWVNGKLIDPPRWKRGGQKGNSEIPLIDEGYEFREPTRIFLNKGWNKVLIKAPVSTFTGEWQNPVKWMFTFMML